MTIPSTVSAALHGTPYPDSRLTDEERLARYVGMLDADAKRSRDRRAAKVPIADYRVERLAGQTMRLIDMDVAA